MINLSQKKLMTAVIIFSGFFILYLIKEAIDHRGIFAPHFIVILIVSFIAVMLSFVAVLKYEQMNKGYEQEIAERKILEAELLQKRKELATIIETVDAGIIIVNEKGEIEFSNQKMASMLGVYGASLMGKPYVNYIHPIERHRYEKNFEQLLNGSVGQISATSRLVADSGRDFWVLLNSKLIANENNNSRSILAVFTDITALKQTETKLRDSETRMRHLFNHAPDAIFLVDTETLVVLDANQQACRLLSLPQEKIIGFCQSSFHVTENQKGVHDRICSAGDMHAPEHSLVSFEDMIVAADGEHIPVEIICRLVKIRKKQVFLIIYHDIRSRKKTEQEKTKLQEQLRHSQKMEAIGLLAGGVAHDFNNILHAIIGYGHLLEANIQGDQQSTEFVKEILASAERASDLTKGLLAFSRKQVITLKPLDINDVVNSTKKLLLRIIGEDINLETELRDKDLAIMADFTQIQQILINLATNSRDAMPDGGTLRIVTERAEMDTEYIRTHGYGQAGKFALITVSDTGFGIPEKDIEHIFKPFYTTKEAGKGTGLGLSIVYGIVKQHQGYVDVVSKKGQGTEIKIYFPIADASAKTEEKKRASQAIEGGCETIMLVEDDQFVRKVMHYTLKELGYNVMIAANGEEAIDMFTENKDAVDLVITDLVMPGKNGVDLLNDIRRMKPEARAILISGYAAEVFEKKAGSIGNVDFIQKPVRPLELLKKTREVLDRKI